MKIHNVLTLSVIGYNGVIRRCVPHEYVCGDVLGLQSLCERSNTLIIVPTVYELLVLESTRSVVLYYLDPYLCFTNNIADAPVKLPFRDTIIHIDLN